jgi:hypothetical protein
VAQVRQRTLDAAIPPRGILHSPNAKETFCQVESHV